MYQPRSRMPFSDAASIRSNAMPRIAGVVYVTSCLGRTVSHASRLQTTRYKQANRVRFKIMKVPAIVAGIDRGL